MPPSSPLPPRPQPPPGSRARPRHCPPPLPHRVKVAEGGDEVVAKVGGKLDVEERVTQGVPIHQLHRPRCGLRALESNHSRGLQRISLYCCVDGDHRGQLREQLPQLGQGGTGVQAVHLHCAARWGLPRRGAGVAVGGAAGTARLQGPRCSPHERAVPAPAKEAPPRRRAPRSQVDDATRRPLWCCRRPGGTARVDAVRRQRVLPARVEQRPSSLRTARLTRWTGA